MNKTVNINLAGTFFHIDESAYGKLTRYLDAIRHSLSGSQGSDEIMKDIETRIAELFSEKIDSNKQVISVKELDEVIAIMGQPEDYAVDEEIFEDTANTSKSQEKSYKQLFRDSDDKYIAGVSSGLGHYLGMDAIWVRLLWVLLTIFTSGTFVLIYIILWILVPEADTVAKKLTMKGKPVNISNIEQKFKEGYDNVAEKVKNADYSKIKSSSESFFDGIGKLFVGLLTVFAKFIGGLIVLIAASTLIALFIGLFVSGLSEVFNVWDIAYIEANDTILPIWLVSIIIFLAIGIPFFYLFILGLKILIKNLKSLGKIVNYSLLAIWILAILGLIAYGIAQATERAYEGNVLKTETINITKNDTLYLSMNSNKQYEKEMKKSTGFSLKYDQNDNQVIFSKDIRLIVKSTKDSLASLVIDKKSKGRNYLNAKERAQDISYQYTFEKNQLSLDGYFLANIDKKYRNQEVELTLYLPIGTTLLADKNTTSYHRNTSYYGDILDAGQEEYYLEIQDGKINCTNCPTNFTINNMEIKLENMDVKMKGKFENTTMKIDWEDENWKDKIKEGNNIIVINKDTLTINDTLIFHKN